MLEDKQLVLNFRLGDEQAFEILVDRYLKPLYRFVFQFTQNEQVAEDIVQETFVKVWKSLAKFDENKKFSTWLYAIAKNTALDWLKKKKTLPFSVFESADGSNFLEMFEDQTAPMALELWQKMDNAQEAEQFLNSLSPQLRTLLLLHYKEGFSLVEIAEIFGKPVNTIKSQTRRAIIFLRKKSFPVCPRARTAPKTVAIS
jgi:RNA polymerase sigma-70 factor, ECF subfamily